MPAYHICTSFPAVKRTLKGESVVTVPVVFASRPTKIFSASSRESMDPPTVAPVKVTPVKPFVASQASTLAVPQPKTVEQSTLQSAATIFDFRDVLRQFVRVAVVVSVVAVLGWFGPGIYYQFFATNPITLQASQPASVYGEFEQGTEATDELVLGYTPPQNPNLPQGEWIVIPRIGVRTKMEASEQAAEALETGVWRMAEYGQPGEVSQPMIVAAHRYGYKQWWERNDYWKYNSFYLLPELEPGDQIEVISDQRKWVYEIYSGEETKEITDYQADLILYTCKYLNSPVRHVRYARLVNPEADTQAISQR